METLPPLVELGRRICVIGPSNSGKSTLASALGRKLDIEVVHLDRLRHLPDTDWRIRPDPEFAELHDAAILSDAWIMDGNYSRHFPSRFARATGIIVLQGTRLGNFGRYLRRTLFERSRAGDLEGHRDSLKWDMVTWVLVRGHKNRTRYAQMIEASGLPVVRLPSMHALRAAYSEWNLRRR